MYEDYLTMAYPAAELLMTFAFYFLVAGLLLAVLTTVFRSKGKKQEETEEVEDSANVNEYLDKLLENAALQIHKLGADPLTLPDADKNFHKELLFFNIDGGLTTTEGTLKGLTTVHRAGNATFTMESLTCATIRATLGINDMYVASDGKAWLGRLACFFSIGARVKFLKLTVELELPVFGRRKIQANNLVIDDIGTITLDVKKMGLFNRPLQGIGYMLLNLNKGVIKRKVAPPIESAVNTMLENIKMPRLLRMFLTGSNT